MKKTIYELISNTILLVLLGLGLTRGITIVKLEDGLMIINNGYILTFIALAFINFGVMLYINKKQGATFMNLIKSNQVHADVDEREVAVSNIATKNAYTVAIVALCINTVVPFVVVTINSLLDYNLNVAVICIWSSVICMIAVSGTYSISWIKNLM